MTIPQAKRAVIEKSQTPLLKAGFVKLGMTYKLFTLDDIDIL